MWKVSRRVPLAPDHTATDSSMIFIAPKPATAMARRSRALDASCVSAGRSRSRSCASWPSVASASSTGAGSSVAPASVTRSCFSVRLARAETTSGNAPTVCSTFATQPPQRSPGSDRRQTPCPSRVGRTTACRSARARSSAAGVCWSKFRFIAVFRILTRQPKLGVAARTSAEMHAHPWAPVFSGCGIDRPEVI